MLKVLYANKNLKETIMILTLPWGKDFLDIVVPEHWEIIIPAKAKTSNSSSCSEISIVKNSIMHPIGISPLDAFKLKGKKILIIVDDNTRPTPVYRFIDVVVAELEKSGVALEDIMLVPSLGIHTHMTEDEMIQKVGVSVIKKIKWQNHNAFDDDAHAFFGTTSRGTPVYLNKNIADAHFIISIGMIEPHLWAGFGGGLKNILPGLASAVTIGIHHEIIAHAPQNFNSAGSIPEENSFRLDLEEIKNMIKKDIFSINIILDSDHNIIASFCGDPIKAHRAGVAFSYKTMGLPLKEKVDAIIVNSFPMEINLKQSMKCIGNSLSALKPGGIVMGFLKADRGVDDVKLPDDAKPLWLVKRILRVIGPTRIRDFLDIIKKGLNVEEKFFTYYIMQLILQHDLYLYIPSLSDYEVKQLGYFKRCVRPEDVIAYGQKKLKKNAKVAVFPEGGATFPILGKTH
ncbi:MAG: nickel-dependent lactate racemase [Deltaproteobacteria bacterium]|nr:nickel-dependent lactate racemase [Deltaproteobacteria bacterium]